MTTFNFDTLKAYWDDATTHEICGVVWFSSDINCTDCDEYDDVRFPNTGHQCEHWDHENSLGRCFDEATAVVYTEPAGPDGEITFEADGPVEYLCAKHVFRLLSEHWAKFEGQITITTDS